MGFDQLFSIVVHKGKVETHTIQFLVNTLANNNVPVFAENYAKLVFPFDTFLVDVPILAH